jgi:hypothetical protein
MAVFARLVGLREGNRGLRDYWPRCDEAGAPGRIGAQMGLVLGDLQETYEQLTRRGVHQSTPELARLQDRMLAQPLSPAPVPRVATNINDSA